MLHVQPYFRDAVQGDLPAIATIMRGAAPHDPAQMRATPDTYRRVLDQIDRHDGCYLLVGEYDNQIGAVLEMIVFPTLSGCGRTAEIVGVWTAESFRTSGLDGMLLDHAIERASDLGCTRLQVMSGGGRRHEHAFWERAGFIHLDVGYVRTTDQRHLRRIS
ncbi:MAG: GNAT family N-acetyltransferase [Ilumatobacter fluminis]